MFSSSNRSGKINLVQKTKVVQNLIIQMFFSNISVIFSPTEVSLVCNDNFIFHSQCFSVQENEYVYVYIYLECVTKIQEDVFSRKRDSTFTTVRQSVHHQNPSIALILHLLSFNLHHSTFILHHSTFSFHHSTFILHHSTFILHHFATFKLFSLLSLCQILV